MSKSIKDRYHLIDSLRGFALINMVVFHLLYDIFVIYGADPIWHRYPAVRAWERFICVSFILLSGVSLHFSRRPYRRGLIINACGLLITAVTCIVIPDQAIWFGVLNLIGCSMLICALARKLLDKLNPFVGAGLSLGLFAVFYGVPERYIGLFGIKLLAVPDWFYQFKYVAFLGFPDDGFRSSDYFPIITWVFMFILGYYLWHIIILYNKQDFFKKRIPVLDFLGRHSLIIYMLHQPVCYGIATLINILTVSNS